MAFTLSKCCPIPNTQRDGEGCGSFEGARAGGHPGTPATQTRQGEAFEQSNNLILAERHDIPVVDFWLAVDAGYAADHSAAPGAARLTASLLTGGTKKRNALEISDQIQALGAQLSANSGLDSTVVFLSALKAKLDPSLDLYSDVILNPSFPQADFQRQQRLQLAAIEQEKVQPISMALRVLPPFLYGPNNAYGVPFTGSGNTASVSKMTRDDLVRFHDQWFKPNNATLIVVGDTTLAEIQPKLEALFAAWKAGAVPEKHPDGPETRAAGCLSHG